MGRSARQGQPGSVSVYTTPNSGFRLTPEFNSCYDKLLEVQTRFADYVKKQWPWMFDHKQKYNLLKEGHQLGVTPNGALQNMSQELAGTVPILKMNYSDEKIEEMLKDSMRSMVMLGVFFSAMSDGIDSFCAPSEIEVVCDKMI